MSTVPIVTPPKPYSRKQVSIYARRMAVISGVLLISSISLGPLTFWTVAIPAVVGPLLILPALFLRHKRRLLAGCVCYGAIMLNVLVTNICHPTWSQILQGGAVLWFSGSFFLALFLRPMERFVAKFFVEGGDAMQGDLERDALLVGAGKRGADGGD